MGRKYLTLDHATLFSFFAPLCSEVLSSYQTAILSLPIFLMKEKEEKKEATAFVTQLFKDKFCF